jgi:dynein heavy chain
MMSHPKSV